MSFAHHSWWDDIEAPSRVHQTVLLIPGFMASDWSLYPMASRLRAAGHRVNFAGIWCNADCPRSTLERLESVLLKLSSKAHGKIVIVGHSLGGVYARELARRHPELVERAILLGSPLRNLWESSSPFVKLLALGAIFVHGDRPGCTVRSHRLCGMDVEGAPPSVLETIVYSKTDGVVQWQSCIESGERVETIEVESSHCGLACNEDAIKIVLQRLGVAAQPRLAIAARNNRPAHHRQRLLRPRLRLIKGQSVA
jgi:pimeloyl-ACP methyl ester carboxylesterase